jgi:hypothetical protein
VGGLSVPGCSRTSALVLGRSPELLQASLLIGRDARFDDGLEGSVHHAVEVVRLVSGAVVRDAVLREVVRANPLRAIHRADLALANDGRGGVDLLLLPGEHPRAQHTHAGLAVLQLALLVLHRHDDSRGEVGDANGRVGRVDRLATGAG